MNRNIAFYESVSARYSVKPTFSHAPLIHRREETKVQLENRQSETTQVLLHKHIHRHETLNTLLNTNQSLHTLSEALWRIHNSNDSRLSKSFTNLVTQITNQHHSQPCDIEELIQTVLSRIQGEQSEQWRLEKLQRGIL